MLPLIISAFVLMCTLGTGILDNWILSRGTKINSSFPGDVKPEVTVLKASVAGPSSAADEVYLVFTRHQVNRGETLSRIAFKYGLSPGTLISINRLRSPAEIVEGKVLTVPYRDGIRVTPQSGESLNDTAGRYKTDLEMVQAIPGTGDYFVSGGIADDGVPEAFFKDVFLYPVAGKVLTAYGDAMDDLTGISYRSDGIDLSAESGVPVLASRKGTVILTGNHSSYGLYVMMSHAGGWKSFYGNLSRVTVAPGDQLDGGNSLGLAGDSGTARGPGVHFVLLLDGESVDPLDHLY
jgi:murein DD-endopeptidase MepM/ murein hydrolase activator NlpD